MKEIKRKIGEFWIGDASLFLPEFEVSGVEREEVNHPWLDICSGPEGCKEEEAFEYNGMVICQCDSLDGIPKIQTNLVAISEKPPLRDVFQCVHYPEGGHLLVTPDFVFLTGDTIFERWK